MTTAVATDDQTIALAKSGDAEAWRTLYRAHAGRLLVWLRTQPAGDPGVGADDLASEAWLTAASRIADFHGGSDDFAGWLFGIARLQSRNAGRRAQRRRTTPAETRTLDLSNPAHSPAAAEAPDSEGWVAWVLTHLPERERQVVACLDVVGLDVASTATALRMSASAVRVARHRALKRLRALGLDVS